MKAYETVSEATNDLKKRGYTIDFNLRENRIMYGDGGRSLGADEFEIAEVHRFEGMTDPADEAVVYAIVSTDGLKGVLVNGYGIYAEKVSTDLAKKLNFQH